MYLFIYLFIYMHLQVHIYLRMFFGHFGTSLVIKHWYTWSIPGLYKEYVCNSGKFFLEAKIIDSAVYVSDQDACRYKRVYHYTNETPFGESQLWMSEALELEHFGTRYVWKKTRGRTGFWRNRTQFRAA